MDVCSKNPNRTAPVSEDGGGGVRRGRAGVDLPLSPLCSRTNGWSWPPHPFQLLAWLLYLYFALTAFGVFVPLLPPHWIPAGYICTGIMFVCHLLVHLMAVSIDPADYNVRAKSYKDPVPVFDRTKHAHVIENCHCYLCQVDVGGKSKHCSACNKCVACFDHHCRWLNNCVGSRNYWLFLNSVISALLGIFLVVVMASYVFIEFFLDPSKLRTDKHFQVQNETVVWFVFLPVAPVITGGAAIPSLAGVTVALGLLAAMLLGHLLCFHIYLMWNRLSTYEYIVRQRHRLDARDAVKDPVGNDLGVPKINLIKEVSYSGTLGYTNPEMEVEDPTTLAARGAPEYHGNGRVRSSPGRTAEEDGLPTVSAEHMQAPRPHTQKKKKKVHKVPAEVINDRSAETNRTPAFNTREPVEPSSVAAVSLSHHLHHPPPQPRLPSFLAAAAFPLRASLPPLAPPSSSTTTTTASAPPGVQPAGPPAEYHSDSAESLEEIPVALARLGTAAAMATRRTTTTTSSSWGSDNAASTSASSSSFFGRSLLHLAPLPALPLPSPHPRAKQKAGAVTSARGKSAQRAAEVREQRFEMAATAQTPSVFVISRGGGEPQDEGFSSGKGRQNSRRCSGSNPGSRANTPLA